MSEFAHYTRYRPQGTAPAVGVEIAEAGPEDAVTIATLTASREGGVSILSALQPGGAQWYSWALKLLLTAITLAAGFKGEEVTPLFFIGAQMVSSVYVLGTDFWNKLKHCL